MLTTEQKRALIEMNQEHLCDRCNVVAETQDWPIEGRSYWLVVCDRCKGGNVSSSET